METVNHGFESLKHRGRKIWETLPSDLKEMGLLKNFKNAIEKWKPDLCL